MAIVKTESGCKVGWITVDNLPEAEYLAADAARRGAAMITQGYDFGYQSPGEIREIEIDSEKAWRVTTP